MNLLVTGANGQLGCEIKELSALYKNYNFIFTDIDELNITNYNALEKFFSKNKFDYIINCAAYTAVDKAESDNENAALINTIAVRYICEFASKQNALFIHISTDYVFDGNNCRPYTECDLTNPKSIYGKTKLNGEIEVIFNSQKAIIIRTSWLYSAFGNNFVKTIIRAAKEKGNLNVVYDQIGNPTYAKDMAKVILDIIPKYKSDKKFEIYNYSNEGVASWYDFAIAVTEIAGIKCNITPVETKAYPTPAARPAYSVLNKSKIKNQFGINIPYWKDSLKECIKQITI